MCYAIVVKLPTIFINSQYKHGWSVHWWSSSNSISWNLAGPGPCTFATMMIRNYFVMVGKNNRRNNVVMPYGQTTCNPAAVSKSESNAIHFMTYVWRFTQTYVKLAKLYPMFYQIVLNYIEAYWIILDLTRWCEMILNYIEFNWVMSNYVKACQFCNRLVICCLEQHN